MRISQSPQVALGRAIRLRREEIGLTQEALADSADLDPTSIRGLERGIAYLGSVAGQPCVELPL